VAAGAILAPGRRRGPAIQLRQLGCLLRYPETHGDWVRPGIMLYGTSPFADVVPPNWA
jgi:alanine racemase